MRCTTASRLMDDVVDGQTDSDRQAALLAHVADCVACRAEWSAIRRLDQLLSTSPSVSPPPDFKAKVMARLPQNPRVQKPWAGALALFAGTVTSLVFAVLSVIGVGLTPGTAGLLQVRGLGSLQNGDVLLGWLQVGWQIRQTMLALVPTGLIALYALLALVALLIWLGLVRGLYGTLQPASMREV